MNNTTSAIVSAVSNITTSVLPTSTTIGNITQTASSAITSVSTATPSLIANSTQSLLNVTTNVASSVASVATSTGQYIATTVASSSSSSFDAIGVMLGGGFIGLFAFLLIFLFIRRSCQIRREIRALPFSHPRAGSFSSESSLELIEGRSPMVAGMPLMPVGVPPPAYSECGEYEETLRSSPPPPYAECEEGASVCLPSYSIACESLPPYLDEDVD